MIILKILRRAFEGVTDVIDTGIPLVIILVIGAFLLWQIGWRGEGY